MPTQDEIIASMMGAALGPPPAKAAAPAAVAAPAAQAAPPKADPMPTPAEKAAGKSAPTDAAQEPAINFIDIDEGDGKKRQMTADQVGSTLRRYSDLNYRWQTEHAPMKPVLGVVKEMIDHAKSKGHEAKPEEVADLVKAAIAAYLKNPQMGNNPDDGKQKPATKTTAQPPMSGDDEGFSAWERDNAVKLPPGYREQGTALKDMQAMMGQMIQLMQRGMQEGGAAGAALQNAELTKQQGQQMQVAAARTAIENNIKGAMAQNGIQPEPAAQQDFFLFAMQRGYSPEDFIDPQLTATVAADYKANKDAPEIERLRGVAQRRQAFTGSMEGAPGGAAAPVAGDPTFNKMLGTALSQRGMA